MRRGGFVRAAGVLAGALLWLFLAAGTASAADLVCLEIFSGGTPDTLIGVPSEACVSVTASLNALLAACNPDAGDVPDVACSSVVDGVALLQTQRTGCPTVAAAVRAATASFTFTDPVDWEPGVSCTFAGFVKLNGGGCNATRDALNAALDAAADGSFSECDHTTPTTTPSTTTTSSTGTTSATLTGSTSATSTATTSGTTSQTTSAATSSTSTPTSSQTTTPVHGAFICFSVGSTGLAYIGVPAEKRCANQTRALSGVIDACAFPGAATVSVRCTEYDAEVSSLTLTNCENGAGTLNGALAAYSFGAVGGGSPVGCSPGQVQ